MTELQEAPAVEAEPQAAQYTPEEVAAAKEQAVKLISKDPEVSGAAQAMILARRAYGVAHLAMKAAVTKAGGNDACADAISEAMQDAAGDPFDLGELINQTTQLLLPLLLSENARLDQEDAKARQAVVKTADQLRRDLPIATGFEWQPESKYLPRKETLVLHGHPDALRILEQDLLEANAKGPTVLHLYAGLHRQEVTNTRNKPYVRVGLDQWRHAAKNKVKLHEFLNRWVRFARGVRFDLLLVDDLSLVMPTTIAGASRLRSIAEAHKLLRSWCEDIGAGLVCKVPSQQLVPTRDESEQAVWAKLEEHAHVVPLNIIHALGTAGATHYRLQIGEGGATREIPKSEVELLTKE